ncbi:uncharacterized protein LOC130444990 [Diorhabda sublineata]|uniref:uncharacterized protein LOC130444990 n=1 Tax=Diorhabda sublineata TaxID=1163346 RepID=UPI0024E07865|nr:uncharacterized protein LOC130444990 [Diorhabda sublineata]
MPKVESSLYKGGILATSQSCKYNKINRGIRSKRDLTTNNNNTKIKRKIYKKLVRVQLLSNNTLNNDDVINVNVETTTKRRRRRIKIKKKKRKLNNPDQKTNEYLPQIVKFRKRIVVTKKRLINRTQYTSVESGEKTNTIPISSTIVNPDYNGIDYSDYDNDISKENHDEYDIDIDNDYDETTTQFQELVTLKESDFFHGNEDELYNEQDYLTTEPYLSEDRVVLHEEDENVSNNIDENIYTTTESDQIEITTEEVDKYVTSNANNLEETKNNISKSSIYAYNEEIADKPTFQDIPEYEPYFPELTESLDAPIILFKTTVLSSVDLLTKTVVQSRLRTYTFVVTTIAGDEQIVTSTTEVRPHTKTTVITEPVTKLTTLTLLDIDATTTLSSPQQTISPVVLDNIRSLQDKKIQNFDEARNLATRIMSNGVEVIVAGDKTIPGEKDFKRFLTSGTYKPITLKPSTLTENVVMLIPQDTSKVNGLSTTMYPNQFITKTCLTTFTYLTTFLEGSTTTVSSHEQVVSNIATEERNTGKILPTPAMGVTVTQNPKLSVGVFHTTYTYLNTILDGDQPLVVSSKHTVTNTVTAPDDYLSLLKKVHSTESAMKDTNTYYSTIGLEKTSYEGNKTSVIRTNEVVTQVVITESVPPRATSVMTSYIALDKNNLDSAYITTDVVKTYLVTYTYYNTVQKDNSPVVYTNTSVSTDIVTEKLYLSPKTTSNYDIQSNNHQVNNFQIFTTKSYLTTFTYFTTLLQEENEATIVNSETSIVENVVSETIDLSLLDKSNLYQIKNAIEDGINTIVKTITLYNGETFEITAIANNPEDQINPTKVMPIEKTHMPDTLKMIKEDNNVPDKSTSNIITGSTIVFVDDDPFAQFNPTPVLKKTIDIKTSSQTIKSSKGVQKSKRSTKSKTKSQTSTIIPTKTKKNNVDSLKTKPQVDNKIKDIKPPKNDLLGLGSINIDSLQAIAPLLNSMAGFLTTNLKSNRRNDINITANTKKDNIDATKKVINKNSNQISENKDPVQMVDVQNRSPIYIPVRGLGDDFEIAESQNIASFDWVDPPPNKKTPEIHGSSLMTHGIPISPGEIITTNSDVIVGKPGRVGPRIPPIPLTNTIGENDITVELQPPPMHENIWHKKNHEYKRIPITNNFEKPHQYHHQEEYLKPPPPIQNSEYIIPIKGNEISRNVQNYVKNEKKYEPVRYQHQEQHASNNRLVHAYNINQEATFNKVIKNNVPERSNNHEYLPHNHHDIPFRLQEEILRGTKLNNINIKPSVINNEPIMLPEVIERSTGQPLLVNIQPSQIAFVNIPYNRTTALIYGGSTEPHKNGQYFNDPSPYPLQDYSIADGKDRPYIPPSVYQPDLPNQKRVNGVIKVENQLIRHDSIGSNNQNIHIKPTRIGNFNVRENQEVSIPPVSFGVIHSGIDFDAHIINHENTFPNLIKKPYDDLSENQNDKNKFNIARKPVLTYPRPVYNQEGIVDNSIKLSSSIQDHKYQTPSKIYNNIPRPHQYGSKNQKTDISEIMLPPTTQKIQINNLFNQNSHKLPENFKPSYPILEVHLPPINNHQQIKAPHEYDNYDNHKVDDLENEDDEVIEESNTRPLRPGELPYEIVKLQATTTKRIPIFRETKPKFDENTSKITKLNYENKTLYENMTAKQKLTTEKILFPDFDRINLHGVGSHEIVSPYKPEKKPVLIFIDEKEESKHKFFNKDNGDNRDRPSVTSLPINTFKESYNHTTVTSRPTNEFTENNRPKVTSLPIGKFNENVFQNNPTTTSKSINIFKKNRPEITSLPINVFKEYNSQYSTTSNPVSTYKQETRPTVYNPRPSVTSLPIDKVKLFNNRNRPPIISMASTNNKNRGTQTEKPFSGLPSKTISFNEIIKKEAIVPKNTIYKRPTRRPFTSKPTQTSIAVDHKTTVRPLTDMEILKPPPLIPEYFDNSTSTKPQEPVPKISVVMVPPPLQTDEDVFGMIPPPPITSTSKYFMEKDVSSNKTASTTTEVYKLLTLEHPTRKSNYKTSITTTKRRRPVYTGYTSTSTSNIIKQSPKTTPKTIISPTVTNKDVNVNININYSSSTTTISSSEQPSTSEENRNIIHSLDNSTTSLNEGTSIKFDVITSEIHNTGNDIKLESTTPLPSTIKTIYNETKSKITVPTRYITHTKTATVTITKTTVVKSLGMTPSTLTILVTETEKTTIIDTVTEVHTLVKPTNIIETVTTTIKQASSLYPYDIYGSQYPPIKVKPTISSPIFNNTVKEENSEENLEDFIIHETDPPITKDDNRNRIPAEENESILVVMTDKNTKNIVKVPSYETQERDEMITTNRDNNIFLSGILIDHQEDKKEEVLEGCEIECKASRNELCQKINGVSRCTCRPGFARMFPDRPCLPTYTYDVQVTLGRIGKDHLHFYDDLKDPNSTEHYKFVQATNEALDRMVMQSDLRDISHGIKVHAFEPADEGIVSKFYLQLSENVEQNRLEDIFKKYLLNNSLSLGGTDIFASPRIELEANDFNECSNTNFHDCSENAHCFNLKGTYSCSCKEGYSDLSENMLYPGRICSADQVGCETCNYHGTCYTAGAEDTFCDCFQWYTGQYCHINLKVILIALVTLGTLLLGLLLTCIILTCVRGRHVEVPGGINFLPQGNSGRRNTLDRRAMIQDTSSEEDNKSDTSRYVKKQKAAPQRKISKVSLKVAERIEPATTNHNITSAEQKDRSLTVMIPRAKYHPAPPTSPLSNYTSFDVRKPSVPSITNEAKLLSLLDAGPSPNQSERIQQFNNVPSELLSEDKTNSRKTSGALISAGFEVSATVVNNMGTLGTTCGTEADRSENATLIQKISADLLSSTGTRSQFNTLRQSLIDEDVKSEGNMDTGSTWLPRVMTISETLSYDETTTPTPMKRLQTDFDSKPSSQHPNDEANTMAERDLGSTFLLPHTHLYKAERGSDISGFESL